MEPRGKATPAGLRPVRGAGLVLAIALAIPVGANVDVREQRELSFGLIAAGQSTGAVSVTPGGAISCGPHSCLGGHRAERLKVRGDKNGVYDISYSSGDVLTHSGGGGTIPLGNFTDDVGGTLVLNPGGQAQFFIGGDLTIGPLTTGGDYTGTYTVIFNLQ